MKRSQAADARGETDDNSLKDVIRPVERSLRQEEESWQPQNRLENIQQPERTIPGAWANIGEMNGLGLRWGRIVTKRAPYPWELESKRILITPKRPLCYRPLPVICKHCKELSMVSGWWYQTEKECCIYGMINNRMWRSK
jgi:hypothetical protein